MKYIEKLTKEQEDAMPGYARKWIDIGLKTGETDWDTFEENIKICYKKAQIKFPNNIVRVSSPLVGALASSVAEAIWKKKRGAVGDAVDGAVGDAVDGAVGDAVGGAVGGAVDGAVDGAIKTAISIAKNAGVTLSWHYWLGGQFWVGYWGWGIAFVNFFFDICKLELSKDIMDRAMAYRKVCESVNYIWPNSDFIMVCAHPIHIDRNAQGRLHSDKRKSIEYPDGWGLYHLNGVKFEEALWKKIVSRKIPFKDIMNITDVDQRRQALKYGDWDEFVKYQNAVKIDEHILNDINGNPVPHQLWKFPVQNKESDKIFSREVHFARYMCPSTKDWMIKGVPEFKTIAEAMSWGQSNEGLGLIVSPEDWRRHIPLATAS